MTEAQELKLVTKRSLQQTYISQASGSGVDEGTGSIPGVPDVPTDKSEEELSWNFTKDEGDDEGKDGDDDDNGNDGEEGDGDSDDEDDDGEEGDDQEVERDDEKDDEEDGRDDEQEYDEDEYDEETRDDESFDLILKTPKNSDDEGNEAIDEESFDPIPQTPENSDDDGNGDEDLRLNIGGEEEHIEDEEEDELYRDVNINQESFDPILKTLENSDDDGNSKEDLGLNVGREEGHDEEEEEDELYRDVNINKGRGIQATLKVEDSHVTLTSVNPDGQQHSSLVSSQFMTSILNLTLDVGMESIFETTSQMDAQTPTLMKPLPMTAPTMTPSTIVTITTTSQAPILPTTALSTIIQNLPNFGSLFGFDNRLRTLEANFSEFMQTNQFVGAVFASDRLRDEAQRENDEFLKTVDENMQKIIKEQVKEQGNVQVSKILPRIEQTVDEQLEAEVLTLSSHSSKTSYDVAVDLSEMELKKILIEKIEGNKSIQRSDEQRNLYKAKEGQMNEAVQVAIQFQSDKLCEEAQKENDEFLKNLDEKMQNIIKEHVKEQVSKILPRIEQTVNEKLESEVLTQSSYSSKTSYVVADDLSKMELKKILIEKMEGNKSIKRFDKQRNLYMTLVEAYESDKIILDTYGETVTLQRRRDDDADKDEEPSAGSDRGSKRRREGKEPESASAPTKTAPRSAGSTLNGFLNNKNHQIRIVIGLRRCRLPTEAFSLDTLTPELIAGPTYELLKGSCKSLVELEYQLEEVYQATTDQLDWVNPKEWHNYKHLDWITVRRDDDNLYKFKEDLKRKEAYIAYSNPQGFIYQNKDQKNRLIRIDELHKFSNGTLIDVRTALDDRLKGIQMHDCDDSSLRIHIASRLSVNSKTVELMTFTPQWETPQRACLSYPIGSSIHIVLGTKSSIYLICP
nr:hypothetical protein [Tanacetum cinerariifolium]